MPDRHSPLLFSLFVILAFVSYPLYGQTTVTLSTSVNPSVFGANVVLTATVSPSNSTGKVTFYDDVTMLGTKSIVFGGAMLSTFALPAGNRKLRAYYSGFTSNVVTQVVQSRASAGFAVSPQRTADTAASIATGDFNGDGIADLATIVTAFTAPPTQNLAILNGDGSGNFTPGFTIPVPPVFPLSGGPFGAATADFNGDGILDLAIPVGSAISLLLGKGDGTFQTPANLSVPTPVGNVIVGDYNGDGLADLAASTPAGVFILQGRGDGTFQSPVLYLSNALGPIQAGFVASGDFNGDGKPDLAITLRNLTGVSILLGKGDGSFQIPSQVDASFQTLGLAVGDFNADGKADLVTDSGIILLGKGDGTFQAPVTYGPLNTGLVAVSAPVVSDFNGDGKQDVAFASPNGNVNVLYGNGDGTFQSPVILPVSANSLVPGDYNRDGKVDLAFGNAGLLLGSNVTVTVTSGGVQSAQQGSAFGSPLEVLVKDGTSPLSGVTVTFTSSAGDPKPSLSAPSATTGANGTASVLATAGHSPGSYKVTATALGVSATFSLVNLTGPPQFLIVTGGAAQRTFVGTAFAQPLKVSLTDGFNEPVSGVPVTFTAPANGASVVLPAASALTDASGIATIAVSANNIAGPYVVTAAYGNLSTTISLTNLQPALVTLTSSANPATFGVPLVLTATVTNASTTGRVAFYDNGNILAVKPVPSGAASISGVLLVAGAHKLTAYYRDDVSVVEATGLLTETVKAVGGGSFIALNPQTLSAQPIVAATGDFDGDGKTDVASIGQVSGISSWWEVDLGASASVNSVVIWNRTDCCASRLSDYWVFVSNTPFHSTDTPDTLQTRSGTFVSHQTTVPSPAATIATGGTSGRYVRVQLSGPGYLSLAEVQVFGTNGSNLALGQVATESSTLPGYSGAGAGGAVDGITDGDFNHHPVASTDTSTGVVFDGVTVMLGQGDGTFRAPATYAAGLTNPSAVTIGDFNGDGISDLAVSGISAASAQLAVVSVLLGNGNGTFRPAVAYPAATLNAGSASGILLQAGTTGPLAVGDFNGDGKADVLIGYTSHYLQCADIPAACIPQTANFANVLFGNGDGTFGPPTLNRGVFPFGVGDFNGDNFPDTASGGTVILSGVNNHPTTLPISGLSSYLAADLNGDGKADLLAAFVNNTMVLLGNGDGTFRLLQDDYPGAAGAIGDFDGDGVIDVAVTDGSGNFTGILLGNGDGTFHRGSASQAGTLLAVGDFNGDGRADVLTASPGGVTVLLGAAGGVSVALTAVGGTPQSAPVGSVFPIPLLVKVLNNGAASSGVTVTFSAPSTGAGATLSNLTAVTNVSGIATVYATANGIAGSYTVTASVGAVSTSFLLTNVAGGGGGGGSNLAQGKTATQSSTLPGYASATASSAVDGNTNGNFLAGSVSHTDLNANAWWQVDLGTSSAINQVTIFNRTDCCATRLADYWIFISDTPFQAADTPATLQSRTATFASHQAIAPSPATTINTSGAQGRYVRVQLSGTDYLSLAEVQVSGTGGTPPPSNLALNKQASQSSTLPGYANANASSAVDGNTDGSFFNNSVSHTDLNANPWWQADLGASAAIGSVVIWNRTDCCSTRLGDYWVFISDTPFQAGDTPATLQGRAATFVSHQTGAPASSSTVTIPGAQGRYVRIQLSGTDYLSLAEVQVFGTVVVPAPTNVALGKTATQSSTLPGYSSAAAASAVDGNTNGNFFDGSVTHTDLNANAWWQVDVGASVVVSSVTISNRTDCCGTRLNDYWVFISNTPFSDTDTPATLQSRPGVVAIHRTTAPDPSTTVTAAGGVLGRYVRLQLNGTGYLSLAEVQVFGQ